LWSTLFTRYAQGEAIDGQYFALLPEETAMEIEQAASVEDRARLICDFLADQTDGSAARMFQRLFTPDFGSIGDLIG
jgi:dGTPase